MKQRRKLRRHKWDSALAKTAYNTATTDLRILINAAKQAAWDRNCAKLNTPSSKRLWAQFHSLSGRKAKSPLPTLNHAGADFSDDQSKASILNATFSSVSAHPPLHIFQSAAASHETLSLALQQPYHSPYPHLPVSLGELRLCIKNLNYSTRPERCPQRHAPTSLFARSRACPLLHQLYP